MRTIIQRVTEASVAVDGQKVAKIGAGLLVLAGFEDGDGEADLDWMAGKIVRMRIFADADGVMNRSVQETGGEILAVSQFTLPFGAGRVALPGRDLRGRDLPPAGGSR